tara:strand:- start:212 stop:424 length:213 start_codon:yes stop_codon:yes gene_type:complete
MRQWRDQEIEPTIQRVCQTPLQVVARLNLKPGVVAVTQIGTTRERHSERDNTLNPQADSAGTNETKRSDV